jgi:hypothetical protein
VDETRYLTHWRFHPQLSESFHPTSGTWSVWFTLGSLLHSFFLKLLFVAKIHHFSFFFFFLFKKKSPKQHGQKELYEKVPKNSHIWKIFFLKKKIAIISGGFG